MDSIASYASSDSESDSSDSEKKNKMGLSSKRQVLDQQEIQQNRQSKKKLPVLTGKDRGSMVPPISLRHESCIMSTDNLQKYNSIGFELTKDSTVNSISTSNNILKPYIPKSKRKKLANESESVDKSVHTCSKNFPSKLSTIFQRAEPFSQTASLRYRVPKGQLSDFEGHQGCVNRISWNPCFVDFLLSGSMDSVVKVWNVQTSPCCVYNVRSHQQAVKDAKWSHDGLQILSCGYDKMARITDINLGKEVCGFNHNAFVTSVLYHPSDQNVFLSGTSNDGIFAWDIRTQKFFCQYKSFFGQIQDLAFFPDGQSFISAAEILKRNSTDKGIMVWDYKTSTVLSNQVFQEAYTCTALQVHPTDKTFLAQCNAGYIAVFSQKSPYKLNKYKRFEGHQVSGYNIGLDISPDGVWVASGSSDGAVYVYNCRTSKLVNSFPSHSQPCMDVAWSPTIPSLLASCDWNGRISLCK